MTKQELIDENNNLKSQLIELEKQFNYYYRANKDKKEDNYRLRAEVTKYKKEVEQLTLLLSVKVGSMNAKFKRCR